MSQLLILSSEWSNGYPAGPPATIDGNAIPAEWAAALNAAVASGTIPDIPVSTALPNESPTYPGQTGGNPPAGVCSATYGCRIDGDIWDAPDGYFGVSFDDGPTDVSHYSSAVSYSDLWLGH